MKIHLLWADSTEITLVFIFKAIKILIKLNNLKTCGLKTTLLSTKSISDNIKEDWSHLSMI
ncbi:hypothetical protein BpHYR1_005687 [Brachionus plicatilis]|uniref:Uncharacterized protein n=1 Tax=Brachionus plicatilis TaxID=10195 RepID=A0A3M7QU15_BRAPC|nr:hypothetical protein BpHYR1_005687 [Brachionus plicatilis]